MFDKCLTIFSSILELIKKYIQYKEQNNETTFRNELRNDTANVFMRTFGGKDRRNTSATSNVTEHDNNRQ